MPGRSRPCPWSSYSDIFIILSRSKQVTGPTRIKGWRKTQRFLVKTQEHAVLLAWTETRAVPMSPRIGLCSAGTEFCGFMLVRMSLMPPLCKLLCRSVSPAAFLSDTKDRGPPAQPQAWRSAEKLPFGQTHYLRAFEKPPQVRTQALRDFEKVSHMGG